MRLRHLNSNYAAEIIAGALATAIEAGNLADVQEWIDEFGVNTHVLYEIPGDSLGAFIIGNAFNIAIQAQKEDVALWLLRNGAAAEPFSYYTELGIRQQMTYHPLGAAVLYEMDTLVAHMLEQGVDFHYEQFAWAEGMEDPRIEVFGWIFMRDKGTRRVLTRIGRLDVLEMLQKTDLRTKEEREYDAEYPAEAAC